MWAFAYIVMALVAPQVGGGDTFINFVIYLGLGIWMIIALILYASSTVIVVGRVFLFILGLIEVFGDITSWCGIGVWNVPFPNKELFQVSMAFADLLSAVFMFYLALGD